MAEQTNNSLMKKTKAELVKIILRKDDVETELQNKLKEANTKVNEIEIALDNAKSDYQLTRTYKDNVVKENAELQNKLDETAIKIHDLKVKYHDTLTNFNDIHYKLEKTTVNYEKIMRTAVNLLWSTVGLSIAFIVSIIAHFVR